MQLAVGDRVLIHGLKFREEPDRHGVVTELYRGKRSAIDPGLEMAAVRWDDTGNVERGYILASNTLVRYVVLATPTVPE